MPGLKSGLFQKTQAKTTTFIATGEMRRKCEDNADATGERVGNGLVRRKSQAWGIDVEMRIPTAPITSNGVHSEMPTQRKEGTWPTEMDGRSRVYPFPPS